MSEDEHMVTIPGRYSFPPIHLDTELNYEIRIVIGAAEAYPNALDLLDAVLKVALAVNPEGVAKTLSELTEADIARAIDGGAS